MFPMMTFMPKAVDPEIFIDTLCGVKRFMTDKIITDPVLNKAAHDFINAQSNFAKMMLNNYYIISKHSMDSVSAYWAPKKEETT
jgi:hypothetical protein